MKILGDFLCLLLVENQRINKLQYRSFERCAPFCPPYSIAVQQVAKVWDSCGVQRETFRFTIHDIKPAILRSSLPLFRRHFRFLPLTISQKDQKRGDGYDNKWRNRS